MIIKINEKDYTIHFGLASLDYLDNSYFAEVEGVRFGLGLNGLIAQLKQENIIALVDFIKAGTITEPQKPSNEDIENYIANLNDKQFTAVFSEALEEIKKQPLTKVKVQRILRDMEKAQK